MNKVSLAMYLLVTFLLSLFGNLNIQAEISEDEPVYFSHYTNEDGLPSTYVKSIVQDADGFIWAATRMSVVRFDGKTFRDFPTYNQQHELIQMYCNKLFYTKDSMLICRTNDEEYFYYNNNFECFFPYDLLTSLGTTTSITPTDNGFWICQNKTIYFVDKSNGSKTDILSKLDIHSIQKNTNFHNLIETEEWLVFSTTSGKIYSLNKKTSKLSDYNLPNILNVADYDLRFIDSHNNLWINSPTTGLINFNLVNSHFSHYTIDRNDVYRLPHKLVHCFAEDDYGRVWIGTEAGLAIYNPSSDKLRVLKSRLSEPQGLNTDPIYDAFCDKQGNMWLGSYFGGINFWSGEQKFFRTWTPGFGKWQINGRVVSCFEEDVDGNLWIGFEDKGLNKLDVETGKMLHYSSESGLKGLSYDNLHDLLFVNDDELWIATYTGSINVLNTKTKTFSYYQRDVDQKTLSDVIYQFKKVGDTIYIATSEGITYYNIKQKIFTALKPDVLRSIQFESIARTNDGILWFSSASKIYQYNPAIDSLYTFDLIPDYTNINFVKTDSQGRLWIGDCYDGLCMYNPINKSIHRFNKSNHFPASWTFSLEEGSDGWFWVSTDKGLIHFLPEKEIFKLIDSNSGIPFNQFNYRASFTDSKGNIYFGGNSGMVSFNEDANIPIKAHLPIALTDIKLFNESLQPGCKILNKSINKVNKLTLKHNQNVFTIEFSAFNYSTEGRCHYMYYLEGLENDWNNVGNRNFATYTNISPGTYTLHIKAVYNERQSDIDERQLIIEVLPPFWMTGWAYAIYVFIVIIIFLVVFRVGKNIEKSKALAQLEHREKVHADEINRVKLEFFTNISHELKTPLTLILGPLSKIMSDEQITPAFRKRLLGVERNANRLFQLINQLLEFRKIETGREKLEVSPTNLEDMMHDVAFSFNSIAETKGIELTTHLSSINEIVWVDKNKMDKIFCNLLSNAFKFTPEGGLIEFSLKTKKRKGKHIPELYDLIIKVADSGKGIEPELLNKVFDRFFQIEDETNNESGSGIGLAYVKSLVQLHKGTITVDSELGKGTRFKIVIPISRDDYKNNEIATVAKSTNTQYIIEEEIESNFSKSDLINVDALSSKPSILVVEDNVELVHFMKENLEDKYNVITSLNGKEALDSLEKDRPDLIISDIMMPVMDGIELTKKLKSDINYSHIPLILLTAKDSVEDKLHGLNCGADYYMAKPFYPAILEKYIDNIINNRKLLVDKFKSNEEVKAEDITCSESDKQFIEKLTEIIKANISNPDMDVSFIIKQMGVSRSLLHLKLKGLLGCSSTEYIRAIRLKEAVKLISSGKCNFSEAAYETGFSSPTYFTRRFREFYGKSPREYFGK
nr:two-component regulator propeller domain-containing protein [uncultured Carboxylicivirga sp.]